MQNKILYVTIALVAFSIQSRAQVNIRNFEYVNLPLNAHVAGVGGVNASIPDINMMFQNPALINADMHNKLSLNYIPYFANIKYTTVGYVYNFKKIGPIAMGVQYFGTGSIKQYDEAGNDLGTYSANQYLLHAGTSHKINYFTLGASLKFAGSQIGSYSSYALLSDIGGLYKHPKAAFTVGLVIKNFGIALKKYNPGVSMNMPFDVLLGTSYRLEHMPFRFSLTAHIPQKDIVYLDTSASKTLDASGNPVHPTKSLADKIGRHFIVGGEFFIGQYITLRLGYNYLRRRELQIETKSGVTGFSFGAMVKIKAFELAYTAAFYGPATASNFLTLNTSLDNLFKKKLPPVVE